MIEKRDRSTGARRSVLPRRVARGNTQRGGAPPSRAHEWQPAPLAPLVRLKDLRAHGSESRSHARSSMRSWGRGRRVQRIGAICPDHRGRWQQLTARRPPIVPAQRAPRRLRSLKLGPQVPICCRYGTRDEIIIQAVTTSPNSSRSSVIDAHGRHGERPSRTRRSRARSRSGRWRACGRRW